MNRSPEIATHMACGQERLTGAREVSTNRPFGLLSGLTGRHLRGQRWAALALLLAVAAPAWAVNCSALPVWASATAYSAGKQVQDAGQAYSANWWTQGQAPASNSGSWAVWKPLGACDGGGG